MGKLKTKDLRGGVMFDMSVGDGVDVPMNPEEETSQDGAAGIPVPESLESGLSYTPTTPLESQPEQEKIQVENLRPWKIS